MWTSPLLAYRVSGGVMASSPPVRAKGYKGGADKRSAIRDLGLCEPSAETTPNGFSTEVPPLRLSGAGDQPVPPVGSLSLNFPQHGPLHASAAAIQAQRSSRGQKQMGRRSSPGHAREHR